MRYLEQFKGLKRVVWCVDNGWLKLHDANFDHERLFAAALERMKTMPNLTGVEFDDFFNGWGPDRIVTDTMPDGTPVKTMKGSRTVAELVSARRRLRAVSPAAEMNLVLYTEEILGAGELLKPLVEQFDSVTVWTWKAENLNRRGLAGDYKLPNEKVTNSRTEKSQTPERKSHKLPNGVDLCAEEMIYYLHEKVCK